ncbi:MAG: hypothetical protein J3Q66DRAFT_386154 [Benniella sp.]|nr:MAG: hypothetical protein J3Q66DRAFT_386154 [Benniella sp.]
MGPIYQLIAPFQYQGGCQTTVFVELVPSATGRSLASSYLPLSFSCRSFPSFDQSHLLLTYLDPSQSLQRYYIRKDLFWQRLRASRSKRQDAGILNDEYLDEAWIKRLTASLHNRLLQYFRQANAVLHIDGSPSVQKAHARGEKQEKQGESLNKLQDPLDKIQGSLGQASQTDAVTHSRSSGQVFSIQDILETQDIEQEAWTAVGVVTKNDCCNNIPEHAISTNFKALQPISMSETSDPKDILDEYCSQVSEKTKVSYDRSMFQLAYDVFFNQEGDSGST